MPTPNPEHPDITGGCLCGQVRYTIHFPPGSQWPPDPHTCQCTQCRKGTGSLLTHYITFPPSQLTFTDPSGSLKHYNSSANASRGFCANCGSTLTWLGNTERPGEVEICTGTVDERWLVGEEVEGEGSEGKVPRREGGLGKELCVPRGGNFWCRNAIVGVTDEVRGGGKMFVEDSKVGETLG